MERQSLYDRDALDGDDEEDSKTEVAATAAGGVVRGHLGRHGVAGRDTESGGVSGHHVGGMVVVVCCLCRTPNCSWTMSSCPTAMRKMKRRMPMSK